jgi:type VI secretion system secreted protein Hcp
MAADYLINIEGAEGDSKDSQFPKAIMLVSWDWGVTNAGTNLTGQGFALGKPQFQDFNFTMYVSQASPKMIEYCALGAHFSKAELLARKSDGKQQSVYLKITFEQVFITSFRFSGTDSSGPELPMATVSFTFNKFNYEYKQQDTKGSLGGKTNFGYDLTTNQRR